MRKFLELEDVEYISHGDWADPEVKYDDVINIYSFNYYDLVTGLEQSYNINCPNKNIEFGEYLKNNTEVIYSELEDLVNNYWETMLQDSPFKELEKLKEKYGLELFNQSLKYQIKALESEFPEYFLDYFKIKELEVTSQEDLYLYLMKTCFDLGENNQFKKYINFSENMENEIKDYIEKKKIIELKKSRKETTLILTENDLEQGVNEKINDSFYLSYWYDSDGEGIYYEIRDLTGKEIDGGLQLFGLENSRPEILREDLSLSLLKMSGYNFEKNVIERIPNGNIEDIVIFEIENEECL